MTNNSPWGVTVPHPYPASTFFLDESGTKAKDTFVVAGLKVRMPGALTREIRDLRDRHGVQHELKFVGITRDSLPIYNELVDLIEQSDAHLVGCVISPNTYDPFADFDHRWEAHAEILTRLLCGSINRRELAAMCVDTISTPRGCSLEDTVKYQVNELLQSTSLVSAVSLDSRTTDLLQVADMVASAIAFERRKSKGQDGKAQSPKGKVAARLGAAFGDPGLKDLRRGRINVATYRPKRTVVNDTTATRPNRRLA